MDSNLVHIGYGDSAAGCLKEAMKIHGLSGSDVVVSRDDFTQGPLSGGEDLFEKRIHYWSTIMSGLSVDIEVEEHYMESIEALAKTKDTSVVLWLGDSCHDRLATGWILYYLKEQNNEYYIVDLKEATKALDDHPCVNAAMYTPEEIVELYKKIEPLTQEKKDLLVNEWKKVCTENKAYRILENDAIRSVEEDYHDEFILQHIPIENTPAPKAIGAIMGHSQHRLSDTTVEWRIRKMIEEGKLCYTGELKSMFDYQIRVNIG